MNKKFKVIIAIAAAVVVLSMGGAAIVMAADGGKAAVSGNQTSPANGFMNRVASILGVPVEKMTEAVKQARGEMRDEAFIKFLDQAVKTNRLTQAEVDQIKAWYAGRPAAAADKIGFEMIPMVKMYLDQTLLDKLVQKSVITADESKAIADWFASRPVDALKKIVPAMRAADQQQDREKLNKDLKDLQQDFTQNISKYIDSAIASSNITPAEGAQIRDWLTARPAVVNKAMPFVDVAAFLAGPNWAQRQPEVLKIIDQLVIAKRATQAEADQIKAWLAQRPAALDKVIVKGMAPKPAPTIPRPTPSTGTPSSARFM